MWGLHLCYQGLALLLMHYSPCSCTVFHPIVCPFYRVFPSQSLLPPHCPPTAPHRPALCRGAESALPRACVCLPAQGTAAPVPTPCCSVAQGLLCREPQQWCSPTQPAQGWGAAVGAGAAAARSHHFDTVRGSLCVGWGVCTLRGIGSCACILYCFCYYRIVYVPCDVVCCGAK